MGIFQRDGFRIVETVIDKLEVIAGFVKIGGEDVGLVVARGHVVVRHWMVQLTVVD